MEVTRSLSNPPRSSRRAKMSQPFYLPPAHVPTSAEIVEEARRSVRTLDTERPYTPAETTRKLFGLVGEGSSRPPSVFSIGARHFSDEPSSRPSSARKLPPIDSGAHGRPQEAPPSACSLQDRSHSDPSLLTTEAGELPTDHVTSAEPAGAHSLSSLPCCRVTASHTPLGHTLTHSQSAEVVRHGPSSPLSARRSPAHHLKHALDSSMPEATSTSHRPLLGSGSDGPLRKRKSSKTANVYLWDTEISPLLSELKVGVASPHTITPSHLCDVCDALWAALKRHGMLGRSGGVGGKERRSEVLRCVFRLLDHSDPRLLLKLSRIILAMEVTGKNLLNICRLLFSLARDSSNDAAFQQEGLPALLVLLLQTAHLEADAEALVYGLGTVKLLASSASLRPSLAEAGVLDLIATFLKTYSEASAATAAAAASDRPHELSVLVQLTAALRNLSETTSLLSAFLPLSLLPLLSSTLQANLSNADITFNVARTFSKLTLHAQYCSVVVTSTPLLSLLLQAISTHLSHPEILLRALFILGNLCSADNRARENLYHSQFALSLLNRLWRELLQEEVQSASDRVEAGANAGRVESRANAGRVEAGANPGRVEAGADTGRVEAGANAGRVEAGANAGRVEAGADTGGNKSTDVLVKLVRVVANISVHPLIGPAIANDEMTVNNLLATLASLPLSLYEPLLLNCLATLTNLSFYAGPDSVLQLRCQDFTNVLVRVLLDGSQEALLEAVRVLGNLSRHPQVKTLLLQRQVGDLLVTLLDSERRELVYAVCGVLVNLMADSQHRACLSCSEGVRKLVEVLHDFGKEDWQLASLVCQTLWNYSEDKALTSFDAEECLQLVQLLEEYTSLSSPPLSPLWQTDFLPVAKSLLARVRTSLVPLHLPTDSSLQ